MAVIGTFDGSHEEMVDEQRKIHRDDGDRGGFQYACFRNASASEKADKASLN